MASWTCLLFWTLTCIISGCDFSFVNLECNDNYGRLGQRSLLECIVNLTQKTPDIRIELIIWKKEGADTAYLIYNISAGLKSETRFTLAEQQWNESNLNVSMLVTNTMMADFGKYKCTVVTNIGYCSSSTSLRIPATDSSPTIGVAERNQKVINPSSEDGGGDLDRIIAPKSQLASKVVPPVVIVLVIIGLLFFLIKKYNKRTHEEIPTDTQDLCNGNHEKIPTDNQDLCNGEHETTQV